MLKLNYNDYGLFLEQVNASVDAIATQRVMLAVQAGETLHIEPGRAAFLIPSDATGVVRLKEMVESYATGTIAVNMVDSGFVEVSLEGTWIASNAQAEAGTFVTAIAPESEKIVYQLWQATQQEIACGYVM